MSKVVKALIVVTLAITLSSISFAIGQGFENKHNPALATTQTTELKPDIYTIWRLVNNERTGNGLTPLVLNDKLNKSAQAKCEDMIARNYWSHDAPDGTEPWKFIDAQVPEYKTAGENLAYGFKNESETVTGWMKSKGHRDNILNGGYTDTGIAICISQNYVDSGKQIVIVQHFVKL